MTHLLLENFFYKISTVLIIFGLSPTNRFILNLKYKFRRYDKNVIYFLHMHRSAGTSLNYLFSIINKSSKYKIIRFGHSIKINNLNFSNENKYILNLRHPIQLLSSSFIYNKIEEMNKMNRISNKFNSLNLVLENLSSRNIKIKKKAFKIMNSLKSHDYMLSKLVNIKFLKARPPFHIFFYDELEADYQKFCKKILFKKKNKVRVVNKNLKTKKAQKIKFSKLAINNIKNFLAEDIKIFNYLMKNKKKINSIKR